MGAAEAEQAGGVPVHRRVRPLRRPLRRRPDPPPLGVELGVQEGGGEAEARQGRYRGGVTNATKVRRHNYAYELIEKTNLSNHIRVLLNKVHSFIHSYSCFQARYQ